MSNRLLLDLSGVSVTFGGGIGKSKPFVALEDVDLSIPEGDAQIIAIAGESGSGKTTLGRVALGMLAPTAGTVRFSGHDVWQSGIARTKEFRRQVQAVFQDPFSAFNPFYPVEHVMQMPLAKFGIEKKRDRQLPIMADALRKVGLNPDQVFGRYPHQLSGGQRQRIVVARALMLHPRLIVADEPVSMIDASLRANVLENLRSLRDNHGISILYITHDLATARQISDKLYVLYRGRAIEKGTADSLIGNPLHPYTQLLMSSIPRPDPDAPWPGETGIETEQGAISDRTPCVFLDRCPERMSQCKQQPGYFRGDQDREVACHLYADPKLAN